MRARLVYVTVPLANGSPYTSFTFQVQDNGGTAVVGGNTGVDLDQTAKTLTINVTAGQQTSRSAPIGPSRRSKTMPMSSSSATSR